MVPLSLNGGPLNARRYPRPSTVPGSADGSMLNVSMAAAPGARRAMSRPIPSASTVPTPAASAASAKLSRSGATPAAVAIAP